MKPWDHFPYLKIQHCWPESEELLQAYERKVTVRGQVSEEDVMTLPQVISPRYNSFFLP
jgi:hypothetical protein